MNQLDKEDRGSGLNAHGGDPDPEPESKRTKLDVDDPNIQYIKENQVDDGTCKPMEEALSDTSTRETRHLVVIPLDFSADSDDDDHEEARAPSYEAYFLAMTKKWDRKLAKKGVDVEKLKKEKWADWQGKCEICGAVDTHPGDECLYNDFLYF